MLDVPHTLGRHTPAKGNGVNDDALDVPHTLGRHTPYRRQLSDLH